MYLQVQYMIVVTCHASVYTLVLMSLDRFLAVVHPISSISIRTQRNALLWVFTKKLTKISLLTPYSAIIITWLIVITTAFPVFITHGEVQYLNHQNEMNTACLFLTDEGYSHAAFQVRLDITNYPSLFLLIHIIYQGLFFHAYLSCSSITPKKNEQLYHLL